MNGSTKVEATITCLVRFLTAASFSQPIVILLDDAQWLDANSIKLIHALRSVHRILFVATSRAHDGDEDSSIGQFLSLAKRVQLKPLTLDESIEFLLAAFNVTGGSTHELEFENVILCVDNLLCATVEEERSHFICTFVIMCVVTARRSSLRPCTYKEGTEINEHVSRFCHDRAEGIPFVVRSMLQTLLDAELCVINEDRAIVLDETKVSDPKDLESLETPDNVRDLIRARVSKLDPACLSVLFIAATIGHHFALDQLREACEKADKGTKMSKHLKILLDAKMLIVDNSAENGIKRYVLIKKTKWSRRNRWHGLC